MASQIWVLIPLTQSLDPIPPNQIIYPNGQSDFIGFGSVGFALTIKRMVRSKAAAQ